MDILITRDNDNDISNIELHDPGLSDTDGKIARDHLAVIFNTRAEKPALVRKTVILDNCDPLISSLSKTT